MALPQQHPAVTLSSALSLQVPQDAQAAPLGRARVQVKSCSHCSSPAPLGVHGAEGTRPAESPVLCPQCSELRWELEALSEEYQSCLARLRQCRDELNRSHGSQAQVGAPVPIPALPPAWDRPRSLLCALQRDEGCVCWG